jgi:hypothetical protein
MPEIPGKFVVIELIVDTPERGMRIVPADANIIEIYKKVFGPASHAECEKWVKDNGGNLCRVISDTSALPSYQKCKIIPSDHVYPATYSSVFGPDTYADCKTWVRNNCGK